MGAIVATKKRRLPSKARQRRINRVRSRYRRIELEACRDEWKESAAKCIGSSHCKLQAPCQDSVCVRSTKNGISVIALSDGAGSASLSHYGSQMLVDWMVELVPEHLGEALHSKDGLLLFKESLIEQLQIDLLKLSEEGIDLSDEERARFSLPDREELEKVPCSIKDLSATLLCVAVYGNNYLALHLGDGVIGMEIERFGNKTMKTLSSPSNGEFANETTFVTSAYACSEARIYKGRLDSIGRKTTGFILMSDGPEAALLNKRTSSLASACHKLIDANRMLEQPEMERQLALTLQQVIASKTSDDCSIALMSRIAAE